MYLATPEETPYDLKWRMFGIPVRVHPFFWLMSAILGWQLLERFGFSVLLVWMACVFVSILVHELGHALTGKFFGYPRYIVLTTFGGVAVGDPCPRRWQRILVLAAGPGIQFVLYGLIWALIYLLPRLPAGMALPNEASLLVFAIIFLLWINLVWPLVNLLPIFPLDGGQIAKELFEWVSPRRGGILALQISLGLCVMGAIHALIHLQPNPTAPRIPYAPVGMFGLVLFSLLAFSSFQALQYESQRRQWLDDHTWYDDHR